MSEKNIFFDDKKINKSNFNKKKLFNIYDIDVILFFQKGTLWLKKLI